MPDADLAALSLVVLSTAFLLAFAFGAIVQRTNFCTIGIESDIEVERLMLAALRAAGVARPQVDLGHVGVFRALVRGAVMTQAAEDRLFQALQRKDLPELRRLVKAVEPRFGNALLLLPQLYGDHGVLRDAARHLPGLPEIRAALGVLRRLARAMQDFAQEIRFDLGQLRGYRYHSGVVFAAYAPWVGGCRRARRPLRSGRRCFRAFGPATGFSMDLRELASGLADRAPRKVLAPWRADRALARFVERLRARGDIVVTELPGHAAQRAELGCTHSIVRSQGRWQVCKLE